MVSASNGGFFLPTVDSPLGVQAKNWPKRISSFRMVQVALQAAPYKSMRYLVHHTKLTILHPIHPPHPIHHLHHPTIHLRTSQHAGIELLLISIVPCKNSPHEMMWCKNTTWELLQTASLRSEVFGAYQSSSCQSSSPGLKTWKRS